MTPFNKIYTSFLSKILDDEWSNWMLEEAEADWFTILENSITWFKFPRVSLEYNEEGFIEDLSNEEIQIISDYMKCEWLSRSIYTWENIKTEYEERDFSQANLLDKLNNAFTIAKKEAEKREKIYYRSIKGKPFDYSRLAGD